MANKENLPNKDHQESNSPEVPFFVRYLEGQLEDLSDEESKSISGGRLGLGIFARLGVWGRFSRGVIGTPETRKYPSDHEDGAEITTLKYPSDNEDGAEITTLKYPSDDDDM